MNAGCFRVSGMILPYPTLPYHTLAKLDYYLVLHSTTNNYLTVTP